MGSRKGVRIGVVLDPEAAEQLAELAAETKRTRTAVIELAVAEYHRRWLAETKPKKVRPGT
jgi:predicted transcriptional regulator